MPIQFRVMAQASDQGVTAELTQWLKPRLKQAVGVEHMTQTLAVSVRTLHRKLDWSLERRQPSF